MREGGQAEIPVAANAGERFQTSGVATIAAGHAVHDTYTGFLPALLPALSHIRFNHLWI